MDGHDGLGHARIPGKTTRQRGHEVILAERGNSVAHPCETSER